MSFILQKQYIETSDTLEDALWNMIQSDAAHSEMEEFYESYRIATDRDAEYDSNYFLREYGIPAVFDEEDRRDVSKTNAELEDGMALAVCPKCSAFSVDASKWLESVFSLQ